MKQPVNPKNTSHEKSVRVDVVYAGNAVYAVFQKERIMRKKTLALFLTCVLAAGMLAGCGNKDSKDNNQVENSQGTESAKDDQAAADEVAELIDAIYVQERTDKTDEQCAAAKEAWDKLTDAQKALVSGENADPDYFGRDTGDASKDDPLNQDNIGDNEILVVSFGTSLMTAVPQISVVWKKPFRQQIRTGQSAGHLPHRSLSITYRQEMARRSTT